jgi:hypothetical protein
MWAEADPNAKGESRKHEMEKTRNGLQDMPRRCVS